MPASTDLAEQVLTRARVSLDAVLKRWGHERDPAINYSLMSPGKRLRGTLTIECFVAAGGRGDAIAELGAALEVIHAYSLIHDDLPCMDNDTLRRGRATTHVAFDVPTATRAGFAMVPLAARVMAHAARALGLPPERFRAIALELLGAAGGGGMIGGQFLDLDAEGDELSLDALERIHRAKTGTLITAACLSGVLAAGADAGTVEVFRRFGDQLGMAFQIADDLLDATATTQEIGKTAGKDSEQQKATFVRLLGAEGAEAEAPRRARAAIDVLRTAGVSSPELEALAQFTVERRS